MAAWTFLLVNIANYFPIEYDIYVLVFCVVKILR